MAEAGLSEKKVGRRKKLIFVRLSEKDTENKQTKYMSG